MLALNDQELNHLIRFLIAQNIDLERKVYNKNFEIEQLNKTIAQINGELIKHRAEKDKFLLQQSLDYDEKQKLMKFISSHGIDITTAPNKNSFDTSLLEGGEIHND